MDSDSDALETAKERMQEIHLLSDRKAQLESQVSIIQKTTLGTYLYSVRQRRQ